MTEDQTAPEQLMLSFQPLAEAETANLVAQSRSRDGTRIIAGHFPKAVWMKLRTLCTSREMTAQQLLEEALTDLFNKHRKL